MKNNSIKAPKHKYKLMRRFVYLCISKCVHCGLERKKVGEKQWLYGPNWDQAIEPVCIDPAKPEAKPLPKDQSFNCEGNSPAI